MNKENAKFHFRGQMEHEVVKDFYRKHWVTLLPTMMYFVFFLTVVVFLLVNMQSLILPTIGVTFMEILIFAAFLGFGFAVHKFFVKLLEFFMNVVIITSDRVVVIKKSVFLHDDKESIYMKEIQDLQKQQTGIIKNFLHYGELLINVGVPELSILTHVPNPDYHFRLLSLIRQEEYVAEENIKPNQQTVKADSFTNVPLAEKTKNE